jgi:hypothetical protein
LHYTVGWSMEMFQLELMVGKFVRVWFPVVLSTGWCSSRLWLIVKFAPVVFLSECCIRLQWRQWCRSLSFFFSTTDAVDCFVFLPCAGVVSAGGVPWCYLRWCCKDCDSSWWQVARLSAAEFALQCESVVGFGDGRSRCKVLRRRRRIAVLSAMCY